MDKSAIARDFYRKVLSWNFAKLRAQEQGSHKERVPLSFATSADYINTFEPLLFEECRAQMLQSRDEGPNVACLTKVKYSGEHNGFFVVGFALPDADLERFHSSDLLLLAPRMPKVNDDGVVELSSEDTESHLIGIVEMLEPKCLRVKFYIDPKEQRCLVMQNFLYYATDMKWWIQKLCTISTLYREYEALYSSKSFPALPALLQAGNSTSVKGVPKMIPPQLLEHLEQMYNPTQLQAIHSALSGQGMTLIQGPPGTGKTHVILGLLSVLLHSKTAPSKATSRAGGDLGELTIDQKAEMLAKQQPWTCPGYVDIRDDFSKIEPAWAQTKALQNMKVAKRNCSIEYKVKSKHSGPRILVCAPSNGAVDEIVRRLLTDGLLDEHGARYRPRFVRVGPGAHRDVAEVCLENIVQAKLQAADASMDPITARNAVLQNVSIVATTLSFSGASVFSKMSGGFDYVIIDEAAQAVETSTLIPMQYNSKNVKKIGDPKQLPATIISQSAVRRGYDQSLFQRLQLANYPVCMLDIQYRMHPAIRAFPSWRFYDEKLVDCDGIAELKRAPFHDHPCFGPFVLYDLPFSEEMKSNTGSVYNEDEAMMIIAMYKQLVQTFPDEAFAGRVGVISPYKQQVTLLRELFVKHLDPLHSSQVVIDTVDGFQGREKDIIFVSCVRTPNAQGSIGFLSDVRRMNVLLTRPKNSIIIVANANALTTDPDWAALVTHAKSTNSFVRVTAPMDKCVSQLTDDEFFSDLLAKSCEINLARPKHKKYKRTAKPAQLSAVDGDTDDNTMEITPTTPSSTATTSITTSIMKDMVEEDKENWLSMSDTTNDIVKKRKAMPPQQTPKMTKVA